jgi:hypothetical protein
MQEDFGLIRCGDVTVHCARGFDDAVEEFGGTNTTSEEIGWDRDSVAL